MSRSAFSDRICLACLFLDAFSNVSLFFCAASTRSIRSPKETPANFVWFFNIHGPPPKLPPLLYVFFIKPLCAASMACSVTPPIINSFSLQRFNKRSPSAPWFLSLIFHHDSSQIMASTTITRSARINTSLENSFCWSKSKRPNPHRANRTNKNNTRSDSRILRLVVSVGQVNPQVHCGVGIKSGRRCCLNAGPTGIRA